MLVRYDGPLTSAVIFDVRTVIEEIAYWDGLYAQIYVDAAERHISAHFFSRCAESPHAHIDVDAQQ